ncbi:MAG: type II toxin-antitoxin system HicA family toxin [Mesorhizobium sp.]|nr:MAG: type II toxin-antitoxin system HicA family toxin [Mesorhizobium sp.]TIN79175.1 MAG: addiction module toxin, HicA family [Mesorhizobium sp.]
MPLGRAAIFHFRTRPGHGNRCLKSISGKELARAIERQGWALACCRQSSHLRQGRQHRAPFPIHGNRPLKTGLLRHLLALAEMSEGNI